MADFIVNTLDDLFAAFDTINSYSGITDDNTVSNINIQKDIDFNDYSKYWYNQSTIFYVKFTFEGQTININGNNHSIKNIYLVNKYIFYIDFIASNQIINFYDVDFDFVLNRNNVETTDSLSFHYLSPDSGADMSQRTMFYNCTFRAKLFLGNNSNINGTSAYLFNCYNVSRLYEQFTNCIFNIKYYRNYLNSSMQTSAFTFYPGDASNRFKIINCQFYMKLYLTDGLGSQNQPIAFLEGLSIHNTFFILDVRACNSMAYFTIAYTGTVLSNTYFCIKKTDKMLTSDAFFYITAANESSNNNFITKDISATSSEETYLNNVNSTKIKTISYTDAKDIDYLIGTVGFTIKDND